MRKVEIGTDNYTEVMAGEATFGGVSHAYLIKDKADAEEYARVLFQEGPIKEHGVNGCHHEDLIAIVLDRLYQFQSGDFACRENALAITKLEEAMHWFNHRTQNRVKRGVEGTNKL